MITRSIPFSWIAEEEHRLDCGPFTRGGVEAKKLLEGSPFQKEHLANLTQDGIDGMFHVGMDKLRWVDGPEHGVPFLRSSDILRSDLSAQPYISASQVAQNELFDTPAGSTLITRSGTIGRMAYCRPEMAQMATSQDVLKVTPDPQLVPPGYLYAFLSSKFGVPLVTSGTFGSIIVHIEAGNIADLPVPRLDDQVEQKAHNLVEHAARARSSAASLRAGIISAVESDLGWERRPLAVGANVAMQSSLQRRFDAFHHSLSVTAARSALDVADGARLGDVTVEVFEPGRGARQKVDDPAYGVPFVSSSEIFRLDPQGEFLISRTRTRDFHRWLVTENDLLLPRSGQLGGVIGRAVLPLPTYFGYAASEHIVRIRCQTREDAYFLWAVFASQPGYYAAIGTAYGSSIPSLDCIFLADLRIPWHRCPWREEIIRKAGSMVTLLTEAIQAEREAVSLVECTIEEAALWPR